MLFNSVDFAIFLPIVFSAYWLFKNRRRAQNWIIVFSSYIFYGWWDWRFLILIWISTFLDYTIGLSLGKEENSQRRKGLLLCSVILNLGMLGFFKYYNFFLENFITAFTFAGLDLSVRPLSIVLPVGISFYTFQTLSYTIDVFRKKITPTKDLLAFASFVSFFPQLVAGPIERAKHLLPQFENKRFFNYANATDGMNQILWGLVKKVVIADNCAQYANQIFTNYEDYSGSTLFLGALFFAFQIYGDFSGYSDIAIGTARLFGFDLMKNFAYPYFSRDIAEFWRRWHISLSTWFRDYLYIPLGGSFGNKWQSIRNIFIIFLVSGFWHGANWTFIVWGAINAILFIPLFLRKRNRKHLTIVAKNRALPTPKEGMDILLTFLVTLIAWVFFRADSIDHAISYLSIMASKSILTIPDFPGRLGALYVLILISVFICIEWIGRRREYATEGLRQVPNVSLRWAGSFAILMVVYFFGNFSKSIEFIYFQF